MNNESTINALNSGDLSNMTTYQAGVLQASTNRMLQKYCDKVLKQYGITKTQWLIIGTVLDAGPDGIRMTALAEKIDATLPYLTNTINLLATKGMLQRKGSGTDNRAKLVFIEKRFALKCTKIEATLRQALRESVYDKAKIDPHEFRVYMKVMYQLAHV